MKQGGIEELDSIIFDPAPLHPPQESRGVLNIVAAQQIIAAAATKKQDILKQYL